MLLLWLDVYEGHIAVLLVFFLSTSKEACMKLVSVYKKNKTVSFDYMKIDDCAFLDFEDLIAVSNISDCKQYRFRFQKILELCAKSVDCAIQDARVWLFGRMYVRHDVAALWSLSLHMAFAKRLEIHNNIKMTAIDAVRDVPESSMYITVPIEFLQVKPSVGGSEKQSHSDFYKLDSSIRVKTAKDAYARFGSYKKTCEHLNICYRSLKRHLAK